VEIIFGDYDCFEERNVNLETAVDFVEILNRMDMEGNRF